MALKQTSQTIDRDEPLAEWTDLDERSPAAALAQAFEDRWSRFAEVTERGDAPAGGSRAAIDADRHLTPALDAGLGDTAVVLHHRKAPRSRAAIDHLIVAPSGVWIVDTTDIRGRVQRRDVGDWRNVDLRLYIDGRDQTKLLDRFAAQKAAVRKVLDTTDIIGVPIHPVLLFIDDEQFTSDAVVDVRGVRGMWAKKLIELAGEPGPLDALSRSLIASRLGAAMKARRGTRRTDA